MCCYTECIMSVFMLNLIMLNVIMLNVIMLNVVLLSVVAPKQWFPGDKRSSLFSWRKMFYKMEPKISTEVSQLVFTFFFQVLTCSQSYKTFLHRHSK